MSKVQRYDDEYGGLSSSEDGDFMMFRDHKEALRRADLSVQARDALLLVYKARIEELQEVVKAAEQSAHKVLTFIEALGPESRPTTPKSSDPDCEPRSQDA